MRRKTNTYIFKRNLKYTIISQANSQTYPNKSCKTHPIQLIKCSTNCRKRNSSQIKVNISGVSREPCVIYKDRCVCACVRVYVVAGCAGRPTGRIRATSGCQGPLFILYSFRMSSGGCVVDTAAQITEPRYPLWLCCYIVKTKQRAALGLADVSWMGQVIYFIFSL